MVLYGVYGAGGCGRGVMPIARGVLSSNCDGPAELVFVDDGDKQPSSINGHRVVKYREFKSEVASEKYIAIAIANGEVRAKIASKVERDRVCLWSLSAPNVVIMDAVNIGGGAVLSPFVTLTSNVTVGRCFHANLYSYVEHDCVIGDFVTFAPGVKCNGNVTIHDFVYVGAGAMIRHGQPGRPLVIGRGAVVGMGAVVTKDVPPGVTVVGNPARPLVKPNHV